MGIKVMPPEEGKKQVREKVKQWKQDKERKAKEDRLRPRPEEEAGPEKPPIADNDEMPAPPPSIGDEILDPDEVLRHMEDRAGPSETKSTDDECVKRSVEFARFRLPPEDIMRDECRPRDQGDASAQDKPRKPLWKRIFQPKGRG